MEWLTFKSYVWLILQLLLTIQTNGSQTQETHKIRPHSEIYSKDRVNQYNTNSNSNAQFSPTNNTTRQTLNTRHFPSTFNSNNLYQYQQPYSNSNLGYPGGNGINYLGINPYGGYPGSSFAYPSGTSIGFPQLPFSGYPNQNGNRGFFDGGGFGSFYPQVPNYPLQQNFQLGTSFKPPYQATRFMNAPQGFGGFYPNYPVYPTANLQINQGLQNFYPATGNKSPHDGFDVGSLPRQVRVPGTIQITLLSGRNAEITCEFPRYLLLVQGIYWHHKYDPFGSYFDTQNGFAPHITVQPVDQWKSVLKIQDFGEDDFGTYRCLSAAALPTDDKPVPVQFQNGFTNRNGQPVMPISTTEKYLGIAQEYDSGESQSREERVTKRKNSRKMKFPKFPPTKKLRFTRQSDNENALVQDDQFSSSTDPSSTNSNEAYDPFVNNRNYDSPAHLRNSFPDYGQLNNNNNYGFNPHLNQNPYGQAPPNRHLGTEFGNYPGFGVPSHQSTPFINTQTPVGLQVPYYKPSYSIYTVFQEVIFQQPTGGEVRSSGALLNTSPNPAKI